jgi:hypothetical protein
MPQIVINYSEFDSLQNIVDRAKGQFQQFQMDYINSKNRYLRLTRKLHGATPEECTTIHEECDCIENQWKAWGVEF